MCVCSRGDGECQNRCQSLRPNPQRDDVNDALVKMWSPSDNSAELKGQSCRSRREQTGECSRVVAAGVYRYRSCRRGQVSHVPLTRLCLCLSRSINSSNCRADGGFTLHVLLFYGWIKVDFMWVFFLRWSTEKGIMKMDLYAPKTAPVCGRGRFWWVMKTN